MENFEDHIFIRIEVWNFPFKFTIGFFFSKIRALFEYAQ